jgi:hypothetical protein
LGLCAERAIASLRLKRRVPAGLAIVDDEEPPRRDRRCRSARPDRAIAASAFTTRKASPSRRPARCAENRGPQIRSSQKLELRKLARMLAEAALDLVAQVMEIDARLAHAGAAQPLEVGGDERHVEEGE